jgi:hypothetical protein
MISKFQQKAKDFASKHGYKLRKISEGKVKIVRLDGSQTVVHDFSSAQQLMMSEVYGNGSEKNIFDF